MSSCDRAIVRRPDSPSDEAQRRAQTGGDANRDGANASNVRVVSMTVIPGAMVAQMINSAWDAVITSADGEKILVRRRTKPPPGACPLLGYEVRRISGVKRSADETG